MHQILKTLIDEGILDFKALVFKYYHKFKLSETEAMVLIKLHKLLQEKQQIIKPKVFAKWVSVSPKETETILNNLVSKGYLTIHLYEDEDGKETETFNIDYFMVKVVNHLSKEKQSKNDDLVGKVVDFLEDMFNKPLSQLDFETIHHWIHDEGYAFEMIKDATYKAFENKYPSMRQIDRHLVDQMKNIGKTTQLNKASLKEFHKLWEE